MHPHTEYMRRWRAKNLDKVRETERKWREKNKALLNEKARKRNAANPERNRAHTRAYRVAIRKEMIAAYGGKCQCAGCHIDAYEFLTIEHVNGGGKQHRLSSGGSVGLYRDLKRRGWPTDGYTVLCMNCNHARAHHGRCPHEKGYSH